MSNNFKNSYVKIAAALLLTTSLSVPCVTYADTVNVGTTVAGLPKEIINEEFMSEQSDLNGYNNWENIWGKATSEITVQNSEIILATELDYKTNEEQENKVLSLKRTSASDKTCRDNYAQRELNIKEGTDKIGISFRIKNMDADNGTMRLLLGGEGKTAELHIDFENSIILSPSIKMPETTFAGKMEAASIGEWYTFEIVIYRETRHIEFYVNGDLRSRTYFEMDTDKVGNIFKGQLGWIGIGTLRASGVRSGGDSALFYVDDFAVRIDGEYDAVVYGFEATEQGENIIVSSFDVSFNKEPSTQTKVISAIYKYENGVKMLSSVRMVDSNDSGKIDLDTPVLLPKESELRTFIINLSGMMPWAKPHSYSTMTTKYVSPTGNDNNDGSEYSPWKTLSKAANEAKAGDTILLADGIYNEEFTTILRSSGTAEKPITIKAANKGKATVIYDESLNTGWKFLIPDGIDYINVEGLDFTQGEANPDTSQTQDIILYCMGDNCKIKNNTFSNAMEEGIKLYNSSNTVIEGNYITDMTHEGMDIFNCDGVIVKDNEIFDVGRVGILCKGNTRNAIVYNNYIHTQDVYMEHAAISVGGFSDSTSPWDVGENTGYECYSSVFYNNIILAKTASMNGETGKPGQIESGIRITSAADCHIYNNNMVGTRTGIQLSLARDSVNGWEWDPPIKNPNIKNNIICNCKNALGIDSNAIIVDESGNNIKDNFDCSNNLYWNYINSDHKNDESGSLNENPGFVSETDFHLQQNSPAIDSGCVLPSVFNKYEWNDNSKRIEKSQNTFSIEFANRDGIRHDNSPNIGVY